MAGNYVYGDAPWGAYLAFGWILPALMFAVGYLEGNMEFEALVRVTGGVAAFTQLATLAPLVEFYHRNRRGESR